MSQFFAYRELRDNLVALILDGHIAEGEALPSVRRLANSHGVNPLTVAKALYNLPAGTLRSVRGSGNFVAKGAVERLRDAERATFLEERWPQIEAEIVRLRLTWAELFSVLPQPRAEGTVRDRSEADARCA